ncbi:helix-turn-helix transcriptional regulator [Streptomyces chartreusis]|uniref:helix-turn-helix transcriptional regulator n=1 Tax=Streptomyces chartreusis TaxID=1969 RepID=UPI00380BE6D5
MRNPSVASTRIASRKRAVTVRVHAADPITHAGIRHCLDEHPEVEVSGDEADPFDVFVVAVENADVSTLKLLRTLSPLDDTRFLLILDKRWEADVTTAVEHGIRAVLMRANLTPAILARAVTAVMEGEGIFPPRLQGNLMRQIQEIHRQVLAPRGLTSSGFSAREIDVFHLLAEGLDLEEIAQKLNYSERTVKNILYNAMKRHQLRNRTHAVSHAIRLGLI